MIANKPSPSLIELHRQRLRAEIARRLAAGIKRDAIIRTLLALILAGVDAADLAAWLDDLEGETL